MFKLSFTIVCVTFLFNVGANPLMSECERVRLAYSNSLTKISQTCSNLRFCQTLRANCPQQIDEVASCEIFSNCMEEQFPQNATRSRKCVYEWSAMPNEPGKCENKNQRFDTIAYRCPGVSILGDIYQDENFNCDGHKGRYWGTHSDYYRKKQAYLKAMEDGTCREVSLVEPESCEYAFRSVSVVDTSHGGTADIIDGPRGTAAIENMIEAEGQYQGRQLSTEGHPAMGSYQ